MFFAKVTWNDVANSMHYHTPLITVVVFSLLLFGGIVVIGLLIRFRSDVKQKAQVHDHAALFEELCKGHELSVEERRLLKRLAEDLDEPDVLFVRPDLFEDAVIRWRRHNPGSSTEPVRALQRKLYQSEDEVEIEVRSG